MNYRTDEKGKFFTPHVTKLRLPVTVCIGNWIVEGIVHLKSNNRLKDELNENEPFIAITQASVRESSGGAQPVCKPEVLIIQKNQIVWIFPRESTPSPADSSVAPS